MSKRKSLLIFVVVLAVLVFFLTLSIQLEYLKAKQVPLIAVGIGLTATIAGLIRTAVTKGEIAEGKSIDKKGSEEGLQGWRRYMILPWLIVVYVTFAVFGLIIGSGLFVGSYMKFYGARWWVALIFALVTPAFIYSVFKVALGLYLYNGLFFPS